MPRARTDQVKRPQIDATIQHALSVPLTLVSAPPGFGKTSAVVSALDRLQQKQNLQIAWISLDDRDNNPMLFWQYLVAAIKHVVSDLDTSDLVGPQVAMPIEVRTTLLLNKLIEYSHSLLLVLDDYHVIDEVEVHRVLNTLLEHPSPKLNLIVVTRADPPLHYHA